MALFTRDEIGVEITELLLQEDFDVVHYRKFNLADHVEIIGAKLKNGLLKINLVKEIPEALKPKRIEINQKEGNVIEHHKEDKSVAA